MSIFIITFIFKTVVFYVENPLGGATIHNAEKEYKLISNNSDLVSHFFMSTFALNKFLLLKIFHFSCFLFAKL